MQTSIQGFRLARPQRHLWAMHQQSPAHLAQSIILIQGNLDAEVLRDALHTVINRHQILRTTFQRPPGMKVPVQVIGEPVDDLNDALWQTADLRNQTAAEQTLTLEELLCAERVRPFDVAHGLPMRLNLCTLGDERHALLIHLPALYADTWSLSNLAREISHAYADSYYGRDGHEAAGVQYVQFSEWQHSLLDGEDAETGQDFWREQTQTLSPLPRLPDELSVAQVNGFAPESWRMTLSSHLTAQMGTLAAQHETGCSTVLLACWQALLWRLTGTAEIAIHHVYDGRSIEMLEDALGLFAQSLPMQIAVANNQSFASLLAQVDEAMQDGYEWQDYFDWEEYAPILSNGHAPSVSFEFNEWPTIPSANGVTFAIQQQQSFSDRFTLQLSCAQRDDTIVVTIYYDPTHFQQAAIARIGTQFAALVESAVSNPALSVSQLNLLTDDERHYLLTELNATAAPYPNTKSIHQLFAEQAARVPQQTAVVSADQQLTYAELNARSNQLAHHLRSLGVGPDVCVGLCLDRSVDMLVGLLAILKAGGAYVPLNPEHPEARLAHQLNETATNVVLTQDRYSAQISAFGGTVIRMDRDTAEWANAPKTAPDIETTPENLVYVIYTSGSTGTPKGVAVTHGNLANYTYFICQRLNLTDDDALHFALVTTITADLGNTCLFPALASGGCLHILGYDIATDGERFARYVAEHPIDILKIVPSHLRALLASRPAETNILPHKYLLIGGESFTQSLRARIAEQNPTCEIINHYGPSETTIGSLTGTVALTDDDLQAMTTVPIGRPIANTAIYILDEHQQPVPIGVPGELYIGGAGVAQGYINQPERTRERFITNPFPSDTVQRLYRTGDLVRYVPSQDGADCAVEFLGRVDNQVKIRGFRVELEEVEAVLAQHEHVQQAVVLAREDDADDAGSAAGPRLVAYVVSDGTPTPSINELYAHARAELPDYMVPAAFVMLDEIPLTQNGKVDRKALPAPDGLQAASAQNFVAPHTPTEEILVGIWSQVLKVHRVGIHDSFFDLGGHSLLAMTIVARMRDAFQVELPLADLFNARTVARLAKVVEQVTRADTDTLVPPILPVPRDRQLPLSFAQQRLWFLDQLAPGNSFYNVPVAARLQGALNVDALKQAFATIIQRHEALRTTFQSMDGQPVQVIAPTLPWTLQVEDLRTHPVAAREDAARQLATAEAQRPFGLAHGPLFRVTLLQLDEADHVLLFTMHHIISDLQSRTVLTREFVTLYTAFSEGRTSPLPEPTVQYADYAYWQRQWLTGDAYDAQLTYWREQLADSAQVLDLPTDRPRPAVQTYNGADEAITLSKELTDALTNLSRQEGVSLYMTLLAAFQTLLHRYTGQDDINVGTPISGRTSAETEGMIGFFLNTLVMRAQLGDNPTFRALLKQVRTTTLGAYAHQEMPFEQLVEALQPTRDMSHAPLFQVSFSTIAAPDETVELPGLTIRPFMGESNTAKFDMAWLMVEDADGLVAHVEYNTDLFDATTIQRMLRHFTRLLADLVANPEQPIGNLALLTDTESAQLLGTWRGELTEIPPSLPAIHEQIAEQAAHTPDAVALIQGDDTLTYAELNQRANQLAHYLQALGIQPETLVGVCVMRAPEMVVALLGILKAGGACLPLDPNAPQERLGFMLADADAPVLLTQERLLGQLPEYGGQIISLDSDWPTIADENSAEPTSAVAGDNLAYMIYTSGSTGQPKGVGIEHRSIADHCQRMCQRFGLTAEDRVLQFTSFSFDASLEQIFNALLAGAKLVLPDAPFWTTTEFHQKIVDYKLTLINIPTVYWSQLVQEWHAADRDLIADTQLRLAIVSGEEMPAESVRLWQQLPTEQITLLNAYGPTETTITATTFEVTPDYVPQHRMPIGRPTPGKTVYILDQHGNPTPVGVPGELCIGGIHVARGYHKRPELTEARFIADPFSQQAGTRLYRTGDLVRFLPENGLQGGCIEFLGRIDNQVKVRGFRIELGEIETVLVQHPTVREAAVTVRQDNTQDDKPNGQVNVKRLVAYLVTDQTAAPSVSDLRAFIKKTLPDYMTPAAFVFLDELPLLPNGKVNRRVLPAPEKVRPDLASAYVAPRDETEQTLADIAATLLDVARIGVNDSFFELGGHSLLATQFMARVRDAFNVDLPLRVLFEQPSVAEIAIAISEANARGLAAQTPAITARSRKDRRVKRSAITDVAER